MTSEELFEKAIGITAPWKITQTELRPSEDGKRMEMHIDVDFAQGSTFICPVCGDDSPVYDSETKTWRHLNFFQYRCYIHARVPRVNCGRHGVKTVNVPWGREGSGFTLMMESVILALLQHMPVSTAAREIGETDKKLWRVLKHYTDSLLPTSDFSDVEDIGIDEYSHRGHNYITVVLSHPTEEHPKARVLDIEDGKGNGAVTAFTEVFSRFKGNAGKVKNVTSDMTHGFRNAMGKAFPNAMVSVDKFHVVKMMNDNVDAVRRREMRSRDRRRTTALENTRYLWLKNRGNLREEQQARLDELLSMENLETAVAYNYRLRLQGIYELEDRDSACLEFEQLVLDLQNSPIREMSRVGKSLANNAEDILNYFDTGKTNSILEGFNSMISIIKNRARGFRNMENFKNMIYFCLGQLKFPKALIMA